MALTKTRELAFGRFAMRPDERRLFVDGQAAKLGGRAFDLLLALVERRPRVVAKNELLDLVWSGRVVEENNLQAQVSTLRRVLGRSVIDTIPGRGYRFAAKIDNETSGDEAPAKAELAKADHPAVPGDLPPPQTRLIGRLPELATLVDLTTHHAMISVVGAAGIGKTTLALAAADAVRQHWPDGVWLVELAQVSDPQLVPAAIAQAVGITVGCARDMAKQLTAALAPLSMLIVLDNCEHVAAAAASLASEILQRAAGVHLLATSRCLLGVPREQVLRLDPLSVPPVDESIDHLDAARFGALCLFRERARAVDLGFNLDASNVADVAQICRQLDGLPLAIELAAARVRLLGVRGLRDRLGERLRLLVAASHATVPRHQTLRAALDWSHTLLSPAEQVVLRRLGVFVGGFVLELAQAVASEPTSDEWAVLDALAALVDQSWVEVSAGDPPRYRLLETTRAYALEMLARSGETERSFERHAHAVCACFRQTEAARFGEHGTLSLAAFMERLVPELDNVRAALSWAMHDDSRHDVAVALVAASAELFRLQSLSMEALTRMQALRHHADTHPDQEVAALFWTQLCALGKSGRLPHAVAIDGADRAAAIYRSRNAQRRLYRCLFFRGFELTVAARFEEAQVTLEDMKTLEQLAWPVAMRSMRLSLQGTICQYHGQRFEESLAWYTEECALLEHETGEDALLNRALANSCMVLLCLKRYEEASPLVRQIIARGGSDRSGVVSQVGGMLTRVLILLGHPDEAASTLRRHLPVIQRDGQMLFTFGTASMLLAAQGQYADAARLGGASKAHAERHRLVDHPLHEHARQFVEQRLRAADVSAADFARWHSEGEAMDESALATLLGVVSPRTSSMTDPTAFDQKGFAGIRSFPEVQKCK